MNLVDRARRALGDASHRSLAVHGPLNAVRAEVASFLDALSRDPQGQLLPRYHGAQRHLLAQRGKLVRPLIVWLVGRALDVPEARLRPYATFVELLHNATLLHDDVIDRADERRHKPTANARFDNTLSVLAGDSLLAEAADIPTSRGDIETTRALAATLRDLVAGEAWQYELQGTAHDDIQLCVEIGELKTGSLLSLCTWIPARLAALCPEERERFAAIGRHVGVSFQLIDDVLDFESVDSGKPRLADWRERKTNAMTATLLQLCPTARPELARVFGQAEPLTVDACEALAARLFTAEVQAEAARLVRARAAEYAALADHHATLVPDTAEGRLYRTLQTRLLDRAT